MKDDTYRINKNLARDILIKELDYQAFEAELFLDDFPPIHPPLAGVVQQWLVDRNVKAEVNVRGITIGQLMENQQCNFLVAVSELNRLLDTDLTDSEKDGLAEILRKPVIYW